MKPEANYRGFQAYTRGLFGPFQGGQRPIQGGLSLFMGQNAQFRPIKAFAPITCIRIFSLDSSMVAMDGHDVSVLKLETWLLILCF